MDSKRMNQLAYMFSDITGKTLEESKEIILQTNTGKAVQKNEMIVIYEQQTENLNSIKMELSKQDQYIQISDMLTIENILAAMKKLGDYENVTGELLTDGIIQMDRQPELIDKEKHYLLAKRNKILQIKSQNKRNVRRIENADRIKR